MQTPEKILASAARKIAKWYRAECSYQLLPNGFILKMNGDSQPLPTIGVVGEQLIGSQDDFDAFLDLLDVAAAVRDEPVAAEELNLIAAVVLDPYEIRKDELTLDMVRLPVEVDRAHADRDIVRRGGICLHVE